MSAAASPPSADSPASTNPARRAWMAVMARSARADLEAALTRAMEGLPLPAFDWLRPPEIGLAMVSGDTGHLTDVLDRCERLVAGRPEVELLSVRRRLHSDED